MNKGQACIKHGPPMFVSFHIFPVHHMSHQCHHHPMQNTYNGYGTCPPWLIPSPPMRNWGKGWSQGQRHTRRFESRTLYIHTHCVFVYLYMIYICVCVPVLHHVCIYVYISIVWIHYIIQCQFNVQTVHITSTWLGCYPPVPSHRIQVSKGPMPQPMQVAQTTWEEHCEEKNRRQRGYRHKY